VMRLLGRWLGCAAAAVLVAACAVDASPHPAATTSPALPEPSAAATAATPPSAAATAALSGSIAFQVLLPDESESFLEVLDLATGTVTRIDAPDQSINEGPAWIGDTGRLLFDSSRAGRIHLFEAPADGGEARQLTTEDGYQGFPAVSPDGSTVVFDSSGPDGVALGLYRIGIDGEHLEVLLPSPPAPDFDSAPAFSPDGTRLAFIRKRNQVSPGAQEAAFVMGVDGGVPRQVTDWDLDVGRVRWSPDGARLLVTDNYENAPATRVQDAWTVAPDGTGLARLTRNEPGTLTRYADWSPDGTRIVLVEHRAGEDHDTLRLLDPATGQRVDLHDGPAGWTLAWPTWRP
jgi:Tol biopolymer transport system component